MTITGDSETKNNQHGSFNIEAERQESQKRPSQEAYQGRTWGVKQSWEYCDYEATHKSDLITHVRAMHECVKYVCENCEY